MMKLEKKLTRDVVTQSRVICATCITAGGDVLAGSKFPLVLFDEATQATEPASLVPLVKGAEELVLIGDHRQLPPLVRSHDAMRLGLHESLFERLARLGVPMKMLSVQYRMHPAIAVFPSLAFYAGCVANGIGPGDRPAPRGFNWPDPHTPLCFEGVGHPGANFETRNGTSLSNAKEAERVISHVRGIVQARDVRPCDIAVITPYAAQAGLLKGSLRGMGVSVSTVDAYQGRETDVVVCSTVRSSLDKGVGFLSDRRRLNVLLTRARRGLIVVGHQPTLQMEPTWGQWIRHVVMRGLCSGEVDPGSMVMEMSLTALSDLEHRHSGVTVPESMLSGPKTWMNFAGDAWPKPPGQLPISTIPAKPCEELMKALPPIPDPGEAVREAANFFASGLLAAREARDMVA